ncbi:MAG: hypothetical protein Q8R72_10845 [Hylemonella sp.]|nr:hypothetical protein [Hylemonella sp.]
MAEWDRRILLDLVDEAKSRMEDPGTSDLQKAQIRELLHQYSKRSSSVLASSRDVAEMKEGLFRIFPS